MRRAKDREIARFVLKAQGRLPCEKVGDAHRKI